MKYYERFQHSERMMDFDDQSMKTAPPDKKSLLLQAQRQPDVQL